MSRINEIRERASKATKGEWVVEVHKADGWEGHYGVKSQSGVTIVPAHCSWDGFGDGASKNNADFIAHSKSDIEYLLSEIDRLNAEQQCVDALLTNLYEYAGVADNVDWIRDDIDLWRNKYRNSEGEK